MQFYKKKSISLCLLLMALTAGLALFLFLPSQAKGNKAYEEGAFVLLLSEVDAQLPTCLHVGDRVIDRQRRCIIGDISEIRTEESRREIYSEAKGALVWASVPNRRDVFLTLRAERKGGVLLAQDGTPIRLGQTYHFCTYDFTGTGRVVSLI